MAWIEHLFSEGKNYKIWFANYLLLVVYSVVRLAGFYFLYIILLRLLSPSSWYSVAKFFYGAMYFIGSLLLSDTWEAE